ncbi:VIT domain-containing protein [Flavobacterium reichenbachii]|uniref:TonB-dependent receptor n=1 Tax=Flavobacterium reichenbachii TaxID=362418 RepID=A0A085ZKJ5_9FLAO|nr:VIT domain-containing protein [Flavobacterium reichenbachii]KFF04959.1 TonB-dependent receptor [Flavobacterium reichenbachii]OXB15424.1 TonB-dependent receptor [Flavobacterium reichenbachii]
MKPKMFKPENFQIRLGLLFYVLLCLGTKTFAQSPELTVKGDQAEKVRMSQLIVNVKVVGNIAYTTAEMHFFNSSDRQMEAELIFPLPENVSVSRYAIDINGKMREAVPVDKNKGKQVFEAIEHRRVDPGLLEKVDGNNFRTRIYPLLPNGERIVIIGYEEELGASDKNNLAYQLVSRYPKKLDKFDLNVSVLGIQEKPAVTGDSEKEIVFSKWDQTFQASLKKENYQPSEKLLFKIPIQQNVSSVVTQNVGGQYYFYGNAFVDGVKTAKKLPNSIGLIWDNSLSCQTRDLKKELDLLDSYLQKIKNTKVTLYFLNYTFQKQREFVIADGNWAELKAVLEKVKYDGGTRFSQLNFDNQDEYLFFTDGLSSLSENVLPKTKRPVYAITSSVSADFAFLNFSSTKTGGNFINLNQTNPKTALDKLTNTNLKFLGIKENLTVTDLFPMEGSSVSGNFSFSGISLNPKNEITLLFGYNNEVVLERKISLDAVSQNTTDINIEKLWAQKKIANLELQYDKNADEIEVLGKKYGIVTKNTSLIVLESLLDYISYDIVPPAELRAEFDRIRKQEQDINLAKQTNNWENIDSYFQELSGWWKRNVKYAGQKISSKYKHTRYAPAPRGRGEAVETIKGDPDAIVTVDVLVHSVAANMVMEDNNVYQEATPPQAPQADQVKYVKPVVANSSENQTFRDGDKKSDDLKEVVIVGYATKKREVQTSAMQTISSRSLSEKEDVSQALKDKTEGKIENKTETVSFGRDDDRMSEIIVRAEHVADTVHVDNNESQAETKIWNPDRLYLKALAKAPKEKQYDLYFELRKSQEQNPSFYFDVAHFFYNQGDVKKALQIISNIADLGLENHQLYKTLTYTLRQWKSYEDALYTAEQVAKWRAHEPQSLRDYALALEDSGKHQEAFDELIEALEVNYYGEMSGQYEGVEDIILMDMNRIMASHSSIKTGKLAKKYLQKMPVDIRIILNWNLMDVDLDLHVIEPTGEECYYSHKTTRAGARFSKDFTEGYGPEQYLIRNAVKGKYLIKTNYFGETELTESGPATLMVEIYTTKAGKTSRILKTIQLGKIKENGILAQIVW